MVVKPRKRTGLGQEGLGLIEVMIAGSVMMVLAVGIASIMTQQNKQIKTLRHYASRDDLKNQIDQEIKKGWTVVLSAGGAQFVSDGGTPPRQIAVPVPSAEVSSRLGASNLELYHCLWGDATCDASASEPTKPIYLIPTTESLVSKDNAIGGLSTAAVYYETSGRRCTTAEAGANGNARCSIQVTTFFGAACKDGSASCAQAEQISLAYKIAAAPGAMTTAARGSNPIISTITGKATLRVADILGQAKPDTTPPCPDGQVLTSSGCQALDNNADCASGEVLSLIAGQFKCIKPLPRNFTNDNVGQSANQGVCEPGKKVEAVNSDGSVRCSAASDCVVAGTPEWNYTTLDLTNAGNWFSVTLSCQTGYVLHDQWYRVAPSASGSCSPTTNDLVPPRAFVVSRDASGVTVKFNAATSYSGAASSSGWCISLQGLCCR